MEQQVETQRAEVAEGREQAPVLPRWRQRCRRGYDRDTDLVLHEDGTQAVEELPWRDYVALHQHAGRDCRSRPYTSADGHLPEPLLERDLAKTSLPKHVGHGEYEWS